MERALAAGAGCGRDPTTELLPLFIVLKTGADLGMHAIEHRLFRSAD